MKLKYAVLTAALCVLSAAAAAAVTMQTGKHSDPPQTAESSTADPAQTEDLLNADSYQLGYDTGYAEGIEKGEADQRAASELEAEQAYEEGFRDGFDEGVLSGADAPQESAEPQTDQARDFWARGYAEGRQDTEMDVQISGSFTATVRAVMPDFVSDPDTNRIAAVTFFQDAPVLLGVDPQQLSGLTVGETYTFVLAEQTIRISAAEWYRGNGEITADALYRQRLTFTEIRTPNDDEYGLDCFRVKASAVSDPV